MLADLEPFVEFAGHHCLGHANEAFCFGYRCKQTGVPFAIVEIPASTVAQFVPLQASVRVTSTEKSSPSLKYQTIMARLAAVPKEFPWPN